MRFPALALGALLIVFAGDRPLAQDASGQSAFEQGQQLYQRLCAGCHGAGADGGNASTLFDDDWAFGDSKRHFIRNTEDGITARGMPGYSAVLTESQIESIWEYVTNVEVEGLENQPPDPNQVLSTIDYEIQVEPFVLEGLEIPWAIDFIDARTALITERPGRLRVVESGQMRPEPVAGTPEVLHEGQGGLMEVTVHPDYAENSWIYLSYSHTIDDGSDRPPAMTRIVRGRLDGNQWVDQEVIYEAPHDTYRKTRHHYGSRIVFTPEGYLFFCIGDRGARDRAQDLDVPYGKVFRIWPDGAVPDDNPYVDNPDALPEIYSIGHRNPQGLAVHPRTGDVWETEHGPRGGDEVNLIRPGHDYGWYDVSYGINYNGTIFTDDVSSPDFTAPIMYWTPSIAACGLEFYDGDLFSRWQDHLLAGGLRFEEVQLLDVYDERVLHNEVIVKGMGRVRDVDVGPEGAVYVVLNSPDRVVRLTPIENNYTDGAPE